LSIDRDEMSNLYRGPSIDASYKVSLHLAERFQRRRLKCEKLRHDKRKTTDDGRRTPSDDKSSRCLSQGELKIPKSFFFLITDFIALIAVNNILDIQLLPIVQSIDP
jgi:hypothetical protein